MFEPPASIRTYYSVREAILYNLSLILTGNYLFFQELVAAVRDKKGVFNDITTLAVSTRDRDFVLTTNAHNTFEVRPMIAQVIREHVTGDGLEMRINASPQTSEATPLTPEENVQNIVNQSRMKMKSIIPELDAGSPEMRGGH